MRREMNKGYFGDDDFTEPKKEKPAQLSKKEKSKQLIEELGDMFDLIVKEIEERQDYFESVQSMGANDLAKKTKKEIVERVAELQKITKILNEERAKLSDDD